QNSRVGQELNARILRRGIARRTLRADIAISFSLESRAVLGSLSGTHVYYCTDSFEDLPGANALEIRRREQELLDAADVVVACSKPLYAQLAERGANAVYLPHGCDLLPPPEPPPVPAELAGRPRPFVGYVGSINFRIDAT